MVEAWAGWIAPVIAAPFVGSFLGVVIRRLPAGRPVAVARSECEGCGRVLPAGEMVPLASFAWLRGRCRGCGAAIAPMHLWVELAAVAVAVWAACVVPDVTALWLGCLLGWALLALGWIDWAHLLLPDVLTLPLLLAGLGATAWLEPDALGDRALASGAGSAALRGVELVYRRLRGREGLGAGDAKLLAAAGAWVGLAGLPWVVFGGAVLGLAGVLIAAVRGRPVHAGTEVPFGTALAGACWLVWLYG